MQFNDQNFNQNGGGVSELRAKGHYDASDEGREVYKTVKMHHIRDGVKN